VRRPVASALLLLAAGAALGCFDRASRPAGAGAPLSIPTGPDPIVLRAARTGGILRAARYPALDTTIWRSAGQVPSLDRVLGFGADDGYLGATDGTGAPVRVDLRLGTVTTSGGDSVTMVSTADGGSIFVMTQRGEIVRETPYGGDWSMRPALPAHALFAQPDGSLIVAGASGDRAVVWRVRPPTQGISDSLSFDVGGEPGTLAASIAATAGAVGDRIFFGADQMVIAVRTRDLGRALEVDVGKPIRAIAATPSGDRLFVALEADRRLRVIDRFEERVTRKLKMPGPALALRMDPLGRMLLARGGGDSVYVISLGSDAVVGVLQTPWRGDLPLVLPDGAIATARGADVVLVHPETLGDLRTVVDGASQFWHVLRWNGFRPRAKGIDQPVQFRTSAPRDSLDVRADSGRVAADSVAPTAFTVSFAAVLDEGKAREVAGRIRVEGQSPRITTVEREGQVVYRVVLGPYATRGEAERVGRASGQSFWIFEGTP